MYIIVEGEVELCMGGFYIKRLRAGDTFGEVALL